MSDSFTHTRSGELFRGGDTPVDNFSYSRRGELARRLSSATEPILPAAISATSTISGALTGLRRIPVAAINATSSLSDAGFRKFLARTGDRFDHSRRNELFRGAGVDVDDQFKFTRRGEFARRLNQTASVPKLVAPAGISATSTVSASVVAQRRLPTAAIGATSSVSGSIVEKKSIVVASVSATSSVSGYVGAQRKLAAGSIGATSVMTASIFRLRPIQPSSITAISSVSGSVAMKRGVLPTAIFATASFSITGLTKLGIFGDQFDHPRKGELFRGAGVASDKFNHSKAGELVRRLNLISLPAGKNVVPADAVIAYAIVTASVYKPQKSLGTASIAATSSVVGSIVAPVRVGDKFNHTRKGELFRGGGFVVDQFNHVWRGEFARLVNINTVFTSSSFKAISGSVSATSSVGAAVTKTGKLTPSAISATSLVSGALLRQHGIQPAAIMATSFVNLLTGGTYGSGMYGEGVYGGGGSGNLSVLRAVKPATILANSSFSASGFGISRHIQPVSILAVAIVTAVVGARRPVAPASINAQSVVTAILIGKRGVVGVIVATSSVSAFIQLGSGRVSAGSISALSTFSASIGSLLTKFSGSVNAKSTISGRIVVGRGIRLGSINATSVVSVVFFISSQRLPGTKHRIFTTEDSPVGSLLSTGER